MAFRVVQVVHHAGASGQTVDQVPEVSHPMFPEHGDHSTHFISAVDLAVPGTEYHVPEQGHLLLKLARSVDHGVEPRLHVVLDSRGLPVRRVVPVDQVLFDNRLTLRVQEVVQGLLVALGGFSLDFVAARSESGSTQQVSHQCNVLVSHFLLLILALIVLHRAGPYVFRSISKANLNHAYGKRSDSWTPLFCNNHSKVITKW